MCDAAVLAFAILSMARAAAQEPAQLVRAPEDLRVMQEFVERVQAYAALRAELESALPALGPTPTVQQAHAHRMELARRVRLKRARAGEGDIFTHKIRGLFRGLIALSLTADEGSHLRAQLLSEEAPRIDIRVNGGYLETAGLVSVPPGVLLNLPGLPPDLEYRFAGEHLVLRDARAGLIVDFVHDAVPKPGR